MLNNQTNAKENGIWLMKTGAWVRAADADSGSEIATATVAVTLGTTNKNTQWTNIDNYEPVIGTDNIDFGQISGAGTYTNGSGVDITGNVFSLNTAYTRGLFSGTGPLSYNNSTGAFSLPVATASQHGYLSSSDWTIFNGKQDAGNYLTALTGEVTATGPGSVAATINKALAYTWTGLHTFNGGAIAARDVADANSTFIVNTVNAGNTASIMQWQAQGNQVAYMLQSGQFYAASLNNTATGNNASFMPTVNGAVISRNIGSSDANPVLTIRNLNAGSIGDILRLQNPTGSVFIVDYTGRIKSTRNVADGVAVHTISQENTSATGPLMSFQLQGVETSRVQVNGYFVGQGISNIGGSSNGIINTSTTGISMVTNVNNANTAVTINKTQGTGNILDVQFGGSTIFSADYQGNGRLGTSTYGKLTLGDGALTKQSGAGFIFNSGVQASSVNSTSSLTASNNFAIGTSTPAAIAHIALTTYSSANAFGTSGFGIRQDAATYTSTAAAGSPANAYLNSFGKITAAASNAQSVTNLVGSYFFNPSAGTNVTATNIYTAGFEGNIQVGGYVKATQYRITALNTAPTSSTDTGTQGEIRFTSSYLYLCTATNTWVRSSFTTF